MNWITTKISSAKCLTEDDYQLIESKIRIFIPIIDKHARTLRSTKILLEEALLFSLEDSATKLWNSVAILTKLEGDASEKRTIANCKLFVSLLLGLHEAIVIDPKCKLRSFRCILNTTRYAIDYQIQSELKTQIQNYCDSCFQQLEQYYETSNCSGNESQDEYKRLKVEMFMVYLQNAMEESDLKMARFYEEKAEIEKNACALDADTVIEICRTVYNAALHLIENKKAETNFSDLVHIMENLAKYLTLKVPGLEVHPDLLQLKYTILLFVANLAIEDNANTELCERRISDMINHYPQKLESYKLAIKFHELHKPGDYVYLEDILMQMLSTINVSANIEGIIGFINHQAELDTASALRCLDYIFFNKMNSTIDSNVLELCLATRFFIISQSKALTNDIKIRDMTQTLNNVQKMMTKRLSKSCAAGIITLLFNEGKQLYKTGKQAESVEWFNLALNELFSTEHIDTGKIQRALQFAMVDLGDFDSVEQIYFEMSPSDQRNALTQLNMFRVYAHRNDFDGAKKCLDTLKESNNDKSVDALIIAVSECKRSTDWGVYGMLSMFDKIQHMENKIAHTRGASVICSLRYTIQMLLKMTEKDGIQDVGKYLPTLHMLLNKGSEFIKTAKTLKQLAGKVQNPGIYDEAISIDDIEWFASACYNLVRKLLNEGRITYLDHLISDCKLYLEYIPKEELDDHKKLYYRYWEIRTDVLSLELLHRTSNWISLKESSLALIAQNKDFFNTSKDKEQSVLTSEEVHNTFIDIIVRSFEAAMNLGDLLLLKHILDATATNPDYKVDELVWDVFTNTQKIMSDAFATELLKCLIDRNMGNTSISDDILSQWIRSLLEVSQGTDEQNCLTILSQFQIRIKHANNYCTTEIEWLTTVIWNRGISYIITDNKSQGIMWCQKALEISKMSPSEALQNQLKQFWSELSSKINLSNIVLND